MCSVVQGSLLTPMAWHLQAPATTAGGPTELIACQNQAKWRQ